ncbi:uncharacterized protein LOC110749960 [Prunus avium]|uniref:Uncharacterized protein LOC110749960 n=1 Tax=Prunus avium TaxID=42229 RepID=A0A6P5RLV9_PRUAV|nr:uncharacterized protein LOC110749960 [Prunus avium]
MNSRGKAIQNFFNDDSDDDDLRQHRVAMAVQHHTFLLEQYAQQSKHGGSVAGREYKNRKREKHHKSLMEDYFCESPFYPLVDFRRRFRMRRELFYRILNDVVAHEPYFTQKIDAWGRQSLSPEQKLTAVFRMLAYGCSADSTDEYYRLGESTSLECLRKFCSVIEAVTAPRLGYKHKPTVVLEAVASYDTWIWHAFFGVAGSNNDINVLARSPLFNDVVNGVSPHIQYVVNGNEYNLGYYLADGIYPRWATLVKTISQPDTPKKRLFAQKQEVYRKDVERVFGILQAQWAIVKGPARMWHKEQLYSIMMTCIILHNMIVEDEFEDLDAESDDEDCPRTSRRARARLAYDLEPTITYDINRDRQTISDYMVRHNRVRASQVHHNLRNDLINHIWRCEGEGQ